MKKFLFIATFLASWLSFASTSAQNVAQIGDTGYETLQAAISAATNGATIDLLQNVDLSTAVTGSNRLPISKSLTFNGNNHIVTIGGRGFGVGMNATSNIDVTFQNITIQNSSAGARCIDTRGNIGTLTLSGVTLKTDGATSGYTQPLTIGGDQATAATVNITNSTIQTNNEGTKYYAIITFNPVNMTISGSTIKGWACIYAKGPDGSAGSAGSVFTLDDCTIVSSNIYSGNTNSFAAFKMEDNNVTINVTNSNITINNSGDQDQAIATYEPNNLTGKVSLGEGNNVTFNSTGTGTCSFETYGGSATFEVSGGTFNVPVPEEYCAEDFIPTDNGDGTYGVKAAYVAQIGTTKYETLAAAVAAVPADGTATTITIIANQTINVVGSAITIPAGKNITIDLNGYQVVGTAEGGSTSALITNRGNLTIMDSSDTNADGNGTGKLISGATTTWTYDGSGNYSGSYASNLITNNGTLTINSGYLENISTGSAVYVVDNQTNAGLYTPTATINGGCLKAVSTVVRLFCNSTSMMNTVIMNGGNVIGRTGFSFQNSNANANQGTLTISGGTITAKNYGVYLFSYNEDGSNLALNLEGGTITTDEGNYSVLSYSGTESSDPTHISITGGTYNNYVYLDGGMVVIEDGTFKGGAWVVSDYGGEAEASVTGGAFANDPSAYCAEGYDAVLDSETGLYTVEEIKVAQIGETKYTSLAAAVAAAQSGATIVVIADDHTSFANGGEVEINKPLTISGEVDSDGKPKWTLYGTSNNSGYNDLFIASSTGTVTVSNLIFSGFGNAVNSKMGHAPVFVGSANHEAVIDNVYISDLNCEGIHVNGGTFTIQNCNIDCSRDAEDAYTDYTKGICIVNDATGSISGTTITGVDCNDPNDLSAGIELQGSGEITISGCNIETETIGISATYVYVDGTPQNDQPGTSTVNVSDCVIESTLYSFYGNGYGKEGDGAVINITSGTYNGILDADDDGDGLNISGGTFNDEILLSYCAEGFIPVYDSETGLYTVQELPDVATIGETAYKSLADAIAAVPTNGTATTITMIANETVAAGTTMTIAAGKNIVLDLNGKTITGSSTTSSPNFYFITNKGTLEITDNSNGTPGKITYACSSATYSNEYVTICNEGGTFTLTKGTVENTGGGLSYAVNNRSVAPGTATFNLNGGTISAPSGDAALRVYQSIYNSSSPYDNIINITSGTILDSGIFVDTYISSSLSDGNSARLAINISGGTVNGLIDMKVRHPFNTLLNITGGNFTNTKMWVRKFASEYVAAYGEPTAPMVTISGGTFDFATNNAFGLAYDYAATTWTSYNKPYAISGGVFELAVPAEYCAEGYVPAENTDAATSQAYPYTVEQLAVAQIGETTYPSLAAAIAAVPDGTATTITMIADETINNNTGVTIAATQNVILDLNGKTLSQTGLMAMASYLIKNNGTLTIKDSSDTNKDGTGNGKMQCSAEFPDTGDMPSYATNLINNYGNLTIESGYYQTLTEEGFASYVVDNYSGATANITGGKLCNVAEYEYVVRMFLNSTTATNTLNISGTTVITGSYAVWMQYANGNANKASLNISGGTINATDGRAVYAGAAGGNTRNATNVEVSISGGNIGGTGAWFGADTEFKSFSVTGGTFADFGVSAVGGDGIISGGTFISTSLFSMTRTDDTSILVEGYLPVWDSTKNAYVVSGPYAAKIGTVGYATFAEAVTAAAGTQTITLLADVAEAYTLAVGETLIVELNGHTLTVNAPTNYNVVKNVADGVTTYTTEEKPIDQQDIELVDGQPYTIAVNTGVKSATYVRTLNENQVNKYMPWYVPFDYTITADDAENFTFYKINLIANSATPGEVQSNDKIWLFVTRMSENDVLYANRPYLFKVSTADTYEFTTEGATLLAKDNSSRLHNETTYYKYDFYGTYETVSLTPESNTYYMSGGQLSYPKTQTIPVGSYRWYIKTTQNGDGGNYAPVFVFVEEDDDATGIKFEGNNLTEESYYNLNGMRINKPANGAYIIKYSDGSVKKVAVK